MKLIKVSILTTPTTADMERQVSVLTFLSNKIHNTLVPNSLDKLMQSISMEYNIYDLDKITNLGKSLKKLHTVVLI